MSRELEELLAPTSQIPWEDAASFLVAIKDATKTAAQKEEEEAESEGKVNKFLREGKAKKAEMEKRSAVPFDPKKYVGPNMGEDATGWAMRRAHEQATDPSEKAKLKSTWEGHVARRKAAFHAKHGTTEEIRARNKARDAERMKDPAFRKRMAEAQASHAARLKDPEYQKKLQASRARLGMDTKVASVRELWKLAQGEGEPITEAEEGFNGVAPGAAPVEPAAIGGAGLMEPVAQGKPKKGKLAPPQTPEHRKMQEAVARLEEEQMADQVAMANEADHYRQVAEETGAQAQELEAALQEAQMALEQTGQQAQMAQMQAQEATQMAQQQAQQDAAEKQQLSDEGLSARQNIMQMRQAMQDYRESLQQIALQDPTAAAGPSPEEQGANPTPGELQSMLADQQMSKEDQQMAEGKPVPQASPPEGGGAPEPGSPEDQAALEEEAAQEAAQEMGGGGKKPPPKKEKKKEESPKVEVNVEKKGSAIPELLLEDLPFDKAAASWKERAVGAAVGAPLFAGIQSLSDIKGKGGESKKERKLRTKLRELESKKDPGALHKHKTTITRALYETAKTNREHPRSAAIIAGLTGAGLGATVGPDVGRAVKGVFGRVAGRGGK